MRRRSAGYFVGLLLDPEPYTYARSDNGSHRVVVYDNDKLELPDNDEPKISFGFTGGTS